MRKCEKCGKELDPKQKRFCSKECWYLWRSESVCGENHPNWKEKVKLTCEQCRKEFEVIPSLADQKFCSRECKGLWMSENLCGENSPSWQGGKTKLICEICGKEFEVAPSRASTARFCSAKCRRLWHQKTIVGENHPNWKGIFKLSCEYCRKEFEVSPYRVDIARFCSHLCYGLWLSENIRGENSVNWQGGKSLEPYGPDWTDKLKEEIRKRDDYTCAISGEIWQKGQEKFPVHHINYCKTDNQPENLITLCKRCHMKTNVNRDLWQAQLDPLCASS